MAGDLEKRVHEMMRKMDAQDWDSLNQIATDDLRGVDEISRQWIHGRKAILDNFRQSQVTGLRTEVRDIKETTWGDVGLVTCWIEQDYTYQGKPQHISAPTTLLFRRMGSDWRLALFHSVPLPEAS
jgi:hypothetical protein